MKDTTLYIDFETSLIKIYVFDINKQYNCVRIIDDYYIMSMAWCFGEGKVQYMRSSKKGDDREICLKFAELANKASLIAAHNGDSFDLKKIHTRMGYWKIKLPPKEKTIDTLKLLHKHMGMTKNSLGYALEYFKLGHKKHSGGEDTWINCMEHPNHKDWIKFERYNKWDVIGGRKLVNFLMSMIPKTDHTVREGKGCRKCGSEKGQWRGSEFIGGVKYKIWFCTNCGRRHTTNIKYGG